MAGGFFFEPTVIGNASIDMRIYKEETFGPAIPCFRFQHDAEAVKMANDTEYGLAAYFYTKVPLRCLLGSWCCLGRVSLAFP